ncbi:nucleoside phosphatase family-domain-containing protein [Aspergillus pseudoustus]|uniref:Nucleoside phosphatase family-domain-containing protein n=1 Tax=Aspergillus pseudoustus TaxID=1810923 RepID=A0ABR4IVV9_9EURO
MGKWHYGVVLDAGSSGTRVHVYRWLDNAVAREEHNKHDLKSLPEIKTKSSWVKKIHPGVSTFADRPEEIGPDHLSELLEFARDIIPDDAIKETPIFLLATAGMRLVEDVKQKLLLDHICSYARENFDFSLPDCNVHIQVIPGVTEGLYGWIATNYLLGSFNSPDDHDHGKNHHTYGFLDMGGASSQIAFAPNATESEKHANDLTLLRLRNIDGSTQEHRVFVTSWLEFGVREARRRYLDALQSAVGGDVKEFPDPCLPAGLRTSLDGKPLDGEANHYLLGTGKFDECLRGTYPLLDKDAPCLDQPCLLNGIHVPAIDFDVNHFVGISEYWHTTHEVFEMGHTDKAYDFNTYQHRVEEFCSQDWSSIEQGIFEHRWGKKLDRELAYEVCFKASWIINVLHDGIGVPRVGLEPTSSSSINGTKEVLSHGHNKGFLDPFQAVNKIDSTEVSWTLGKIVLYAASEVPVQTEEELPVGFGSNAAGVPSDFQYPSAQLLPSPETLHEETWQDTLFDGSSSRRIPGFILFIFIIILATFFLCGRSRRLRLYNKISNIFKCGRGSHLVQRKRKASGAVKPLFFGQRSPSYERILEEGAQDIELGGSDSSRSSFDPVSDSDTSAFLPPKRASSWGHSSPSRLKFDHDNSSSATIGLGITAAPGISAIDRAGLVVRTESRDHLTPLALGPTTNGRRSRAASPSRSHSHKSPNTTPLVHE